MRVWSRLVKVWDRIVDVFMVMAGILFWVQMLIVNVEVFARYFLRPTTWVAEISSILILWVPFMVTAWVLRHDAHVRMDLLLQQFSPRTRAMINCITSFTGVIVMLIVAGAGVMTTISWVGNRTPTVLMLPRSPIIAIIPLGSLMFAIQFLIGAIGYLGSWKTESTRTRQAKEALSA